MGLTGGIATGKSTVSSLFETYQIPVVDCDIIAKSVVQKVCFVLCGGAAVLIQALLPACQPMQYKLTYREIYGRTGGDTAASCGHSAPAYCRLMVSCLWHSHLLSWCCSSEQTIQADRTEQEGPAVAGELDRDALGSLAFNDREARRKLNRAVHPAVVLELLRQLLLHWLTCKWLVVRLCFCHWCTEQVISVITAGSAVKVVDMPLLFESGAYRLLWPRVLVACSSEVQVRRLASVLRL